MVHGQKVHWNRSICDVVCHLNMLCRLNDTSEYQGNIIYPKFRYDLWIDIFCAIWNRMFLYLDMLIPKSQL